MKLKKLLYMMIPDQEIKVYEWKEEPISYTGEAGSTPYWLADMEIDEDSEIGVEMDDGKAYIGISVKEANQ